MSEDERLPQELKEAILYQLYAVGDLQSLATCSLAHRSLYPTSQNYLFRDITLHGLLAATRLLRSLLENPHLSDHVRVLGVEDSNEKQWIVKSQEIPGILDSVRAIQELHFHPSPVAYRLLPHPLRDALLRAISRPSMRVFSLACVVDLPWTIFTNTPRLWDLRLSDVYLDDEERIEFIDWSSFPNRLYDLTLNVNGMFFYEFVECIRRGRGQIFSVDRLRSLSLLVYGMRWQVSIPDLIAPCANTLQRLELGCSVSGDELSDFDLSISLPQLRLLALHHVAVMHLDPRHWVWLSRLLAGAANVSHIAVKVQRPIPRLFCLVGLVSRLANVLIGDRISTSLKSFKIFVPSSRDSSYNFDGLDLEDMDWALDIFRTNDVDVKIERSFSHGLVQPPLLSLDLLNE